jgi:hypothetical protein
MPIPLDLCTTEDHGYHLQDEAAREQVLTLRSGEAPVKSRNGTTVASWKRSKQRATVPSPVFPYQACFTPHADEAIRTVETPVSRLST